MIKLSQYLSNKSVAVLILSCAIPAVNEGNIAQWKVFFLFAFASRFVIEKAAWSPQLGSSTFHQQDSQESGGHNESSWFAGCVVAGGILHVYQKPWIRLMTGKFARFFFRLGKYFYPATVSKKRKAGVMFCTCSGWGIFYYLRCQSRLGNL